MANAAQTYTAFIDRLEPELHPIDPSVFYASAAISLKRLADAAERDPMLRVIADATGHAIGDERGASISMHELTGETEFDLLLASELLTARMVAEVLPVLTPGGPVYEHLAAWLEPRRAAAERPIDEAKEKRVADLYPAGELIEARREAPDLANIIRQINFANSAGMEAVAVALLQAAEYLKGGPRVSLREVLMAVTDGSTLVALGDRPPAVLLVLERAVDVLAVLGKEIGRLAGPRD